jgi:hypothetical protein
MTTSRHHALDGKHSLSLSPSLNHRTALAKRKLLSLLPPAEKGQPPPICTSRHVTARTYLGCHLPQHCSSSTAQRPGSTAVSRCSRPRTPSARRPGEQRGLRRDPQDPNPTPPRSTTSGSQTARAPTFATRHASRVSSLGAAQAGPVRGSCAGAQSGVAAASCRQHNRHVQDTFTAKRHRSITRTCAEVIP